jgi:hypothetical protein
VKYYIQAAGTDKPLSFRVPGQEMPTWNRRATHRRFHGMKRAASAHFPQSAAAGFAYHAS